ncbi:hypothetical protein Trydic_g20523 [Trypoxylus dichotomus]
MDKNRSLKLLSTEMMYWRGRSGLALLVPLKWYRNLHRMAEESMPREKNKRRRLGRKWIRKIRTEMKSRSLGEGGWSDKR